MNESYGANYGATYGPGGAPAGDRVILCPDGKYRWIYEVNLWRNPTVFVDVLKAMAIAIGITYLLIVIIGLIADGFDADTMAGMTMGFGIAAGAILVVSVIGYAVYALMAGGKYVVLFTMDERMVEHRQLRKEVKRDIAIAALGALVGILSGRPGVAGTNLLAAARDRMITELASVKRVIPQRSRNVIKVNELLEKNRVYVPEADFDFVLNFLRAHCPQAR